MNIRKRALSLLLALIMIFSMIPLQANAAASGAGIWNGTATATAFEGGTGTSSNPYQIATAAQLNYLAKQLKTNSEYNSGWTNYGSKYYKLTADLDMGNYPFIGIHYFNGSFDGNNHTIAGLNISSQNSGTESSNLGLFGIFEGGTIKNLTTKGNVYSSQMSGGIVAQIRKGTVSGCTNYCTVYSGNRAGGIVGCIYPSASVVVEKCKNYGMVTGNVIGGIVGELEEENSSLKNYTTIKNCANMAAVKGYNYVGGIAGYSEGGDIQYCANTGNITCLGTTYYSPYDKEYAGGIVGEMDSNGCAGYYAQAKLQNCYNAGAVSSSKVAGGIAARIVGNNGTEKLVKTTFKACYNAGTVKGSTAYHVGITDGYLDVASLYYLSTINSGAKAGSATGLDATQMTQKSSFSGFSSSYWSVSTTADYKYPYISAIGLLPTACAHNWADATCQAPQTCTSCGTTQGSVGSHKFKNDTCTVCGLLGGSCGTNMTWMLKDGVLTITGTGSMKDYSSGSSSPFYKHRNTITRVELPDGITSIGKNAFNGTYPNLEYIEIPTSVTHIREAAFGSSYDNIQLKYPGTMAQWNDIYITSLQSYSIEYGAECSDGTILYKGNCGDDGTWDNVQYALLSDGTLKITGSGTMEFYQYLNGESHWGGDERIIRVEIEDGVTNIAAHAFEDCVNLKEVHIPASVKSISYDVFAGCTSLTDIYYGSSEKDWNQISISTSGNDPLKNATIHYTDPCAAGHTWVDATCVAPKTCSVCDAIEGDVDSTAHTFANSICTDCGAIRIDEITFPDANFRAYITSQTYGADGALTKDELGSVIEINVNSKSINDLTGIAHFTVLKYLYCDYNQLTNLDVSDLATLKALYCNYNQLTNLDVSGCTSLAILSCSDNQLTNLDVSGRTALTTLFCNDNLLTKLDVSGCTALDHLSCHRNQLTSVNVSDCTSLTTLYCFDNQLTNLDVSGCTSLTKLSCFDNQLTNLDVSGCTSLAILSCSSNQLTSLDVGDCGALVELSCHFNQLAGLDVSGCTSLTTLECYDNKRVISVTSNQFNLSSLAVDGFDISKASNWHGGDVSDNILTATAKKVTYTYDLGNGKVETFTLVIDGFCSHTWTPADCVTPKTCSVCGATEGEALGHDWVAADCDTPKTCDRCGATEGESLGHAWADADCDTAKTCSVCGETEGEALGHTEEEIPAVPATCTATGLTAGKRCTVCNTVTEPQQEVPANGHKDDDQNYACDICGEDLCTEHQEESIPGKDATCTETGLTEGKKCALCGDILVAQEVVPVIAHTEVTDQAVAPTCTATGKTEGKHCSVCNTVLVAQQTVAANGHTEVTDKAVAPTCTATGKTEGKHCSVCNTVLVAQQTVAAKGHKEVVIPGTAATCTTLGKTDGKRCEICNTVTVNQQTIPAKGHTEVVDKAVEATCTTAGKTEGSHCSDCGVVLAAQKTIAAKGHTAVPDAAVAATCTKPGKTSGSHCKTCGTVISKQQTIPAKGHTYTDGLDGTCNSCGIHRETTENRTVMHMFRMYDPNSGEHFYTGSVEERENLVAAGWNYEGVGFTFSRTTGMPVYRLYDPVYGEHLYTMQQPVKTGTQYEGKDLYECEGRIWLYEGIAFNSAYDTEVPQYRLRNPNATRGAYHFTSSTVERDNLIAAGWISEGICFYSSWK